MSTNQYREETDKVDFSKLTTEEQKKYSREHFDKEQQDVKSNEEIANEAKKKMDQNRAEKSH